MKYYLLYNDIIYFILFLLLNNKLNFICNNQLNFIINQKKRDIYLTLVAIYLITNFYLHLDYIHFVNKYSELM